jgi:hypothetical protein
VDTSDSANIEDEAIERFQRLAEHHPTNTWTH